MFVVLHLHGSTRFIDEVDGLVGQEAVVDVAGTCLYGKIHSPLLILHTMEFLVVGKQLPQDILGLLCRRLLYVYLLEASCETLGAGYVAVQLLVGGGTDEAYAPALEIWLEHVGGIHRPSTRGSCSHHGVYLVDIYDVVITLIHNAIHHLLDSFLKVTTELGAGQQSAHIQLVDMCSAQTLGHLLFHDESCQPPHDSRLAHTRFAHVQRIVLVPPAQHLYGALKFLLASDERGVPLYHIVHAGHQIPPDLLARLLFLGIGNQIVIILRLAHQQAQEFSLVPAGTFLEQISRPRLLQLQHGCHKMSHIDGLRTTHGHFHKRKVYQFRHLFRRFGIVFDVLGYHLLTVKEFLDTQAQSV